MWAAARVRRGCGVQASRRGRDLAAARLPARLAGGEYCAHRRREGGLAMAARGYQNYHGKKNGRRIVLVVVLLLVLVLCIGYLALQDHFVYESDGSVTLDFLRGGEGAAPDAAEEEGADAPPLEGLVTEVKGETGVFYYQSDWAVEGAVDERAVSRSSVTERLSGDRTWSAVAAIHCLRDDFYAAADMEGAGICQPTGYIWYGTDNAHYLEPSKSAARAYLCGVAGECRDMGFDEILLRSFGYPTRGNLNKIDYSAMQMSKGEALELLVEELRETVGEDTALSAELPADEVLSGGSDSGVELARIVPLLDRLYVTGSGDRAALEAAVELLLEGRDPASFLVLEP